MDKEIAGNHDKIYSWIVAYYGSIDTPGIQNRAAAPFSDDIFKLIFTLWHL